MNVNMSTGSGLVDLPSDLLRRVACFLDRDNLGSLSLTSPTVNQHLSIGSINHPDHSIYGVGGFFTFNDRFEDGWGYAAKLQGATTFANRPIHSVQVSFRWKDQGWGNQKGMVRVVAVNANNNRQVSCTGIAPHEEAAQKSMCFVPVAGTEYFLQVRVGHGGGHSLHLKNIQLQYIIFDDEERSISRTHRHLLGGCDTTVPFGVPSLLRQCGVALAELQGTPQNNHQKECQEAVSWFYSVLKRMGGKKTPEAVTLLREVLLAESKHQEQLQATSWTIGIGSTESMPITAYHPRGFGFGGGGGWGDEDDDEDDESDDDESDGMLFDDDTFDVDRRPFDCAEQLL
ncbi:expressed unknown protein [Seminavis robusta]|uniref:F-box domain-containing protein n=1 Tax=Seminavis robusta TaxID=568900 RepID=A0A9N8H6Y3_9STRA|nr:expressed unknown protein [Seminavis robusta]|eukprot:Sro161_g072560.1 n/a (343) ;mRNA; r:67549-68577